MSWQSVLRLTGVVTLPLTLLYIIFHKLNRKKVDLRDKVVFITGSTSGLGKACGHVFYKAGCKLILTGRNLKDLEIVKEELVNISDTSSNGLKRHPPEILVLDVTDITSISSQVTRALSFHRVIDILINNAGISYRGEINTTDLDVYRKVMEVNYFGQVAVTKAILPAMLKQRSGTIVAVSSLQGKISIPFRSAYSASKHALQAFCDCLQSEVARQNINVCAISPGYIQTNLSMNAVCGDGTNYGKMDNTTASGMKPEAVAKQILQAVVYQKKDVVLAACLHKLVIYLRTISPSLFHWIMIRRAKKQSSVKSKEN